MRGHPLRFLSLALLPGALAAQGLTTAAISGTVTRAEGGPIAGASVLVTNISNGRRWELATRTNGTFLIEDAAIGGPYRVSARAVGFASEQRAGITLSLGQRVIVDFELRPATLLVPVVVTDTSDSMLNSGRTGPAEIISASRISSMPNIGRDFLTLTTWSPQTIVSPSSGSAQTGGITIAGQNRMLNGFQIDGGTSQDLYTGRLPGRETLPRPISLLAIDEIQVLPAPFDVRHGNFAGGLVNAVTRSGGNTIHGSAFGFFNALSGPGVTGRLDDFRAWESGVALGGPIVPDRAHYFVSVDVQQRITPDPGPLVTDTAGGADISEVGVPYADVARFRDILSSYGLDPGSLGPVEGRQPAQDLFGKITIQLGTNNHLEASHHHAKGERHSFAGRRAGLYALSSTGASNRSSVDASRLNLTSLIGGRVSNQLIVGYFGSRDQCRPTANYPAVVVLQVGTVDLWGGAQGACAPTSVRQEAIEVTESVTMSVGAHVMTLGFHGEALRFIDDALLSSTGTWTFSDLDNFAAGRAIRYSRGLPGAMRTTGIDFRARQVSLYAQDRWNPSARIAVTIGLRVDIPDLPKEGRTNFAIMNGLRFDTGTLPGGNPLWSPRLGINYDLTGDGQGFLRGGVGLFSGRLPYSWLASAYRDDGTQELFLDCRRSATPAFDPVDQPTTCTDGSGAKPRLSVFDPDLRFPQNLKVALGVDRRLWRGVIGTLDLLYTQAVHQLYLTDANLLPSGRVAAGEGNRPLYGTISEAGVATPTRRDPTLGQVVRVSNRGGDAAFSLSTQLRTRFGDGIEASALYGWSRARDLMSLVNYPARANLEHTPLDGTLEDRALRPSYFDVPHRAQLTITARLPHGVSLSMLYAGASGTPYTYVVTGDPNADGIPTAQLTPDIMYVPQDSLDIDLEVPADWARLSAVIEAEPCLRRNRGRILPRNSCRNPWFGTANARLAKAFPTFAGQNLEVIADVYNVANLLNRRWGLSRVTAPTPAWPMLQLVGYDASAERGVYRVARPPALKSVQEAEGRWSRWRLELGVLYAF